MKHLLFFWFLFLYGFASAQVNFSSISFKEGLQTAKSEGKMIFLQFEAAGCNQCNDVANKGFENKEVTDKINEIFFCLKIGVQHPDRVQIAQAYNINADKGFGTLFLDYSGNLIHKFLGTTSHSQEYSNQIDIALLRAGEWLKINELEEQYKKGDRSPDFIQVLLQERRALNFPTDSLLDEYVNSLSPDSLQSLHTLAFIAQMAPLLDSRACKVMRKDHMLFDRAWYSMSSQKRVAVNNMIINKSLLKAIKEKSEGYAKRTASFAQGTNTGNHAAGVKAYDRNMLRFYDEINDTANYFRKAIAFYDKYFLTVSADSIKRLDSLNLKKMLMSPTVQKETVKIRDAIRTTARITYRPIVQDYGSELNNGAYQFYLKTDNPHLLSIATEWVEKALQFYKSPGVLDTYAKLLYKQNQVAKAVEIMSEAIALQQKRGYPTKDYDAVLQQMKNKSALEN